MFPPLVEGCLGFLRKLLRLTRAVLGRLGFLRLVLFQDPGYGRHIMVEKLGEYMGIRVQ